ncbi:5-formyltetrahydrofolate cyclo-ligase [Acinetobacter sp. MD2(2019)]|uniref:5-formyltetrahydrofolate cyclo-ligase n=1 Tax=Acinetobacter sp. MD2(2019) TaxID=2605273 RepID=UPI002D1EEA05|nr:5-formyltetrahydrofolate cyclo-ligase [Acinetobacter sp. MD2(2019)]MEB3753447.1 5-formyltetrahydrofolate cyclo-ligase [Acinetobacter sp. MD2(2019)]
MSLSIAEVKILRKQLRKQRRQLSSFEQKQAAAQLLQRVRRLPQFKSARNVGLYLHAFGEIETHALIDLCFKWAKAVYLPQVSPTRFGLRWIKITRNQWQNRRFSWHPLGMQEPKQRGKNVQCLDLLILPLLGCDSRGTRLGMGGGFYDRTLQLAHQSPYRLGIAHDFQYLSKTVPRQVWDQALHGLCTPQRYYKFKS